MSIDVIFQIAILIFSVVVHEVAHGAMAYYLGDHTAKRAGRLTLNPVPHIDPMGSLILPGLMALMGSGVLFGWAKPVPYNPYNLRKGGRWGEMLVAAAGPLSNFALALVFGLTLQLGLIPEEAVGLAFAAVYINVLLGIFNLLPIPPLDGSKIFPAFLPLAFRIQYAQLMRSFMVNPMLGLGVLLLFFIVFGSVLSSVTYFIARLIAGV